MYKHKIFNIKNLIRFIGSCSFILMAGAFATGTTWVDASSVSTAPHANKNSNANSFQHSVQAVNASLGSLNKSIASQTILDTGIKQDADKNATALNKISAAWSVYLRLIDPQKQDLTGNTAYGSALSASSWGSSITPTAANFGAHYNKIHSVIGGTVKGTANDIFSSNGIKSYPGGGLICTSKSAYACNYYEAFIGGYMNTNLASQPAAISAAAFVVKSIMAEQAKDSSGQSFTNLLYDTVAQPFNSSWLTKLQSATPAQMLSIIAIQEAVGNYLKFVQVQQAQRANLVAAAQVVEQDKTNQLLVANTAAVAANTKLLQQIAAQTNKGS